MHGITAPTYMCITWEPGEVEWAKLKREYHIW